MLPPFIYTPHKCSLQLARAWLVKSTYKTQEFIEILEGMGFFLLNLYQVQYYYNLNYMSLQSTDKTCDQSKQSSRQGIEALKIKITFSNAQLHAIISKQDKFYERIQFLNKKAVEQIAEENYQQAIVYLGEAERNLQYAASCGLAIDRVLITTILKNQACTYQRLWELSSCYDYIEAFVYNLTLNVEENKDASLQLDVRDIYSEDYKKLQLILNQKLNIGLSYLQFSALSSQLSKHEEAIKIVQKSLAQFKLLSNNCYHYEKKAKGKTSVMLNQIQENFQVNFKIKIQKMLKDCKQGIMKMKNYSHFFSFDCKVIQSITMGDIMQIDSISIQEAQSLTPVQWFISQEGLTYLVIYISCCYFALATQLRLGAQKQYYSEKEVEQQLKKAKIYHIHSIKLASSLALIESNFLNHILKSFKNNFSIDILNESFGQMSEFQQISEIVINQKESNSIKLDNNSKKVEGTNKKSDDSGTKIHTTVSEMNEKVEGEKNVHVLGKIEPERFGNRDQIYIKAKRKRSTKNIQSLEKQSKGKKQKSKSNEKCHENSKKKDETERKEREKTKKLIVNNQYFYTSPRNKTNSNTNTFHVLASPRGKITRKQQNSKSRPKLKIKNLKSPNKI